MDPDLSELEAKQAGLLRRLYQFQAQAAQANAHCMSGRWRKAVDAYHAARSEWHRLVEEAGVRGDVDDAVGVNLNDSLALSKALLETLPPNEDDVLGLTPTDRRAGSTARKYGLRAFRYDELATSGTDRKQELRNALGNASTHGLPRSTRQAVARAVLAKDRGQLGSADANLTNGLVSGANSVLSRDLESQDKHVLHRNLGGVTVSKLFGGGSNLNVFDQVGAKVPLRSIQPLVGPLWNTLMADDILSTSAKAKYPTSFLARTDVKPFTSFVVLPKRAGDADDRYVPVGTDFVAEMRDQVLKDRLTSTSGRDLVFDAEAWATPGGFAAIAAWVYAVQIPTGMRRAYSRMGRGELANRFGAWRVNRYTAGGTAVVTVAAATDPQLKLLGSTGKLGGVGSWDLSNPASQVQLSEEVDDYIRQADWYYKQGNRDTARFYYQRALSAIEAGWTETPELPDLVDELELAIVADRGIDHLVSDWSHLIIEYEVSSGVHRILETMAYVTQLDPWEHVTACNVNSAQTMTARTYAQVAQQVWTAARFVQTATEEATNVRKETLSIPIAVDTTVAGTVGISFGTYRIYVNQDVYSTGDFVAQALHCLAKTYAIDCGLNWWGFPDDYVPPWTFDHLFGLARQLGDRSLHAEEQQLRLMEAYESQAVSEYLAGQASDLAWAQVSVAEANVAMQAAANAVAQAQAALAVEQAVEDQKKSNVAAAVQIVSGVVATVGAVVASATGAGAAVGIPAIVGGVATITSGVNSIKDDDIVDAAQAVAYAQQTLSDASMAVASASLDVARLAASQAEEYAAYLDAETLNSEAYLYLVALNAEVASALYDRANLLAWLAQRALEHETRRSFGQVKLNYEAYDDEIYNLTRAARMLADLESMGAAYTAGETRRLQEVKWTVALSELSPGALFQLQENGTCVFTLRQFEIDRRFPGLLLHALQEAQVTFVGTLPAEGPRGVLQTSGLYRVRVPNQSTYTSGAEVTDDWFAAPLASSSDVPGSDVAAWTGYTGHTLKQIRVANAELSLSQFDVQADRAVLRLPQGMLSSVQHIGLDTTWTLRLPRAANDFDYEQVRDVELTLWFRASYDQGLADTQAEALARMGRNGDLQGSSAVIGRADLEDAFSDFRGEAEDAEALDVRLLALDVSRFPAWEDTTSRKFTNLRLGLWRLDENTPELKLRLCCDHDPVGISFTTVEGLMYSLLGVEGRELEVLPDPHIGFDAWVEGELYDGGSPAAPSKNPGVRWVLKVSPLGGQDSGWLAADEDGAATATTSGPLQGTAGISAAGTVRYDDGTSWTNLRFTAKVRTQGSTVRLVVRDDGTDHYALEISSSLVRLLRVESGTPTVLGARSLAYPTDEFLVVSLAVVGSALTATIDGITLWEDEAGGSGPTSGTVALQVTANGTGAAEFDDVEVVRLTGNGTEAESLLSEPFTSSLPDDWTFVDGSTAWAISSSGHAILDLTELVDLVFKVDYLFEYASNA